MNEKDELIHLFKEVQPKFSRFYARILPQIHLTLPQFALLSQLVNRPPVSMTAISARLQITKPAVTSLVDHLEKARFLRRIAHPKDRRVSLLEIQSKGRRAVYKTQTEAFAFLLKALNPLNAAERRTVTRFYATLSRVMDEALSEKK